MSEELKVTKVNIPVSDVTIRDERFEEAARIVVENQSPSIGFIQRQLKIGFVRAYNIMDQLYAYGVVGEQKEGEPRDILISAEQLDKRLSDIKSGVIDAKNINEVPVERSSVTKTKDRKVSILSRLFRKRSK